ncbi:uncharacterized protein I303_100120 [Kwoniella dejecticola CBS 10117]|uniref:Peroxin-7 n=1 Tax=Kwoniella dejecticola CBS 10117 TaxID=1296121 RepID=A0A1A6AE39_9TREE|nr:uncharacterized protein I303_00120 [Kwoniella dejecticola CBS 10117]OBR88309.1 hypothetical protein I303_00120 [Kwoniella dejecticola CBS 10117]
MTPGPPYLRLKTPKFAHNNLSFSPYFDRRFALASGSNFGLVGNGRLHIIDLDPSIPGGLRCVKYFETRDVVFDVAWNESHENQIVAACGDGSIKMFDITLEGLPIRSWHEHSSEIMSIDWNNLQKDTFVTASWDSTIKVWTSSRQTSLLTIHSPSSTHSPNDNNKTQIYNASFSPHSPWLLASCGSDGYINLCDLRQQQNQQQQQRSGNSNTIKPILSIPAGVPPLSNANVNSNPDPKQVIDILHCDWNKYEQTLLATANKDGTVRTYDIRRGQNERGQIVGKHELACRKVQWNPHKRDQVASVGYDMACRVWNTNPPSPAYIHQDHTEFAMGLGWSLFDPGLLASAAWDEEVHLYRV